MTLLRYKMRYVVVEYLGQLNDLLVVLLMCQFGVRPSRLLEHGMHRDVAIV